MIMAVVDVQTTGEKTGALGNQRIEGSGVRAWCDACTVLADVEVEQHFHGLRRLGKSRGEGSYGSRMIRRHGETAFRVFRGGSGHAAAVWTDGVIGQQNILDAAFRDHLRLGDGGALCFVIPAAISNLTISRVLCVLTWGRNRAGLPAISMARAIFRRMMSLKKSNAGLKTVDRLCTV